MARLIGLPILERNPAMLTRLWNRFGLRMNGRPQRRRSLSCASRLEHLEPRAVLSAQISGMVAPVTETPTVVARPQQIARLEASSVAPGQLELRWDGGAWADEFVIKQGRTEIGRVSGSVRSFVVEGLATGQTHRFTVEARNDLGSRTIARNIWIPSQVLPTSEDFSITVSGKGIYTLHLANPRTDDVLKVNYETESGRYLVVFAAGQTSCRLNGVTRGSEMLEFQVRVDRSQYGADYSVRSDADYQFSLPPWRRDP